MARRTARTLAIPTNACADPARTVTASSSPPAPQTATIRHGWSTTRLDQLLRSTRDLPRSGVLATVYDCRRCRRIWPGKHDRAGLSSQGHLRDEPAERY